MHCSTLLALALLATAAPAVGAQSVRGIVVDAADRPVAGVVVVLLDSASREAARSLSNEAGEFRLAGRPGDYRIRTLRIGYRPLISEPIALRAGAEVIQRLALSNIAVVLDTLRSVTARGSCRLTASDSVAAVWGVWEQVRAALTAAQLTAGTRGIAATTVAYDRTMDLGLKRIRRQTADIRSDFVTQPWRSLSPEALRSAGYVVTDATQFVTYHAPGMDLLLSDVFLEDHCLRITTSPDPTRLGIAFEPIPERKKIAEIRGTIWVDRKSSELRSMDFRYVNVQREQEQHAGGDMEFVRMRHGGWAISRWTIRMPVFGEFTAVQGSVTGASGGSTTMRLSEIRMVGGELALVTRPSGRGRDTLWSRPPLVLAGLVADSVTGAPVRNARVTLGGTFMEGSTDAAGKFAIRGVLPGRYTLEVRTPSLDSVNAVTQTPVIFTDSSTAIPIRVPTARQIASGLCGDATLLDRRSSEGILVGSIELRGDTAPPRNARVVAEWMELAIVGNNVESQPRQKEARADVQGNFRICGVALNTALSVRASHDSAVALTSLRIAEGERFGRIDLILDRNVALGVSFGGTVIADSTQRPIVDAEVSLPELGLTARTNAKGEFSLAEVPPGTHEVVVRRLGYAPLETRMPFTANTPVVRRIVLTRVVTLDSIVSKAGAPDAPLIEFEERRRLGLGRFYTRADLARRDNEPLETVLQQTAAVAIVRGKGSRAFVTSTRAVRSTCFTGKLECIREEGLYFIPDDTERFKQGEVPIACYSRVYIDRTLMNPGQPAPPFDLNTIPLAHIEAIEWYSSVSEMPMQFIGRSAGCGVLVIHTRRVRK